MQENNSVPAPSIPVVTPQIVIEAKKSNFLVILLSILLIISVAISGFFAFQTQKLVAELRIMKDEVRITPTATTEPSVEPIATNSASTTIDPTASWKTYTNNVLKYTIKYPMDWVIDKSEAELPVNDQNSQKLVISKDVYKLTILWPSAFGPNICLFDDESRDGAPEMAGYCEGKFIETKSNNNKDTKRRLEKPTVLSDHNQWSVYTKSQGYFVTLPPTNFEAPIIYDPEVIKTMDQILSTYTSIN